VISAARSSRRSAASFARRRAARARARGEVRSCWTGSDLHVGVDAELAVVELGPGTRSVFGVARTDGDADADADAEIRVDIASAAEGTSNAKAATAASDDIFSYEGKWGGKFASNVR
jgi:hypothetical protein